MKVNIKNFGYDSKNFPPIQRDPGRKRSRKPKNDNKFTTGRSKNAGPLLAVSGKSAKMNLKASDKAKGYTDLYDIIEEELQDTLHQSKGKKKKDEESIKFLQVHDSEWDPSEKDSLMHDDLEIENSEEIQFTNYQPIDEKLQFKQPEPRKIINEIQESESWEEVHIKEDKPALEELKSGIFLLLI